jgi:hypothetical protein
VPMTTGIDCKRIRTSSGRAATASCFWKHYSTVFYDLAFDFAELYRAYVPLRSVPTPAGQKRRSK